jgi:hypothetical protein
MNRTIKFRGKQTDNGEWVFGYVFFDFRKGERAYIRAIDSSSTDEVIPETVGQFTGLCDKNGKEIYENDIVNCYFYSHFEINTIYYIRRFSMFNICPIFYDDNGDYAQKEQYTIEVIGNIHDKIKNNESNLQTL